MFGNPVSLSLLQTSNGTPRARSGRDLLSSNCQSRWQIPSSDSDKRESYRSRADARVKLARLWTRCSAIHIQFTQINRPRVFRKNNQIKNRSMGLMRENKFRPLFERLMSPIYDEWSGVKSCVWIDFAPSELTRARVWWKYSFTPAGSL